MASKLDLVKMKALPQTYILSIIDHKSTVFLSEEVTIQIDKSYENNLRERNPQLGRIEAVCESDNPLGLSVGDIVAVNHFTFYGDIGANKSFVYQPHVEWEGVKLFRVLPRQIYFKYNEGVPQPIGDIVLCASVAEKDILGFDPNVGQFFHTKEFVQVGTVAYANCGFEAGDEILVLRSSMYLITLDRVDYFKVLAKEIVARIVDGEAIPVGENVVVRYKSDEFQNGYSPLLRGTGIHITNNLTAEVVAVADVPTDMILTSEMGWKEQLEVGDAVQVYRQQGVPYKDVWVVEPHTIIYAYEKA